MGFIHMRSDEIRGRVERSYEKYEWTREQREVFDTFINERFANYENPKKTVCAYQDTLNQVVGALKNPFSEMVYEDLEPVLIGWQERYGKASLHGMKAKLKAFLRWESGNKHDFEN